MLTDLNDRYRHKANGLRLVLLAMVSLAPVLFLVACDDTAPRTKGFSSSTKTIQSTHYRSLVDIYTTFEYEWDDLDSGVPPLLLRRFPTDMHLIRSVQDKKEFFFQSMLPLALLGNQEIRQHRRTVDYLLALHDAGETLSLHQHEELIKIQNYYKVPGDILNDPGARKIMLRRVDIVPPSLILSQAANESGWGMSRFAQHANNIFGEWTFRPGTGLVPEERPDGEIYEVKRFPDLFASIRSYLRNLNTHSAYRSMRIMRQKMRLNGKPLTGYDLASEMRFYSTRRDEYVDEIRDMIRSNSLDDLNRLRLLPEAKKTAEDLPTKKGGLMSSREKISRQSKS